MPKRSGKCIEELPGCSGNENTADGHIGGYG